MQNIEPSIISLIKPWAEIIYFLSGIGIFIIACFGLKQLKLAKDQLEISKNIFKTQSKRASFESAAQQCNEYNKHIIQQHGKIIKFMKENSINFLSEAKIEENEKGFKVNLSEVDKENVAKLAEIADLLTSFINGVEGFSLYIITGISDEDIAFNTLGKVYTQHAEMAAKITAFTRSPQEDHKQIWKLYFKWKKRLESQKLELERKAIDEKIKKNKTTPIRAIGT